MRTSSDTSDDAELARGRAPRGGNSWRAAPRALLAAAATMAIAAACAAVDGAENGAESSHELRTVVLGVTPISDLAPIWLGEEQGIFADHGLDVRLESGQGGAAALPGVVSGDSHFAFGNATTLFVAADQGLQVQAVSVAASSTGEPGSDGSAILVLPESEIATAADLEGRTVAVNTFNSIGQTVIRQSIRIAGGDPDAVSFVELGFSNMPAALASGDVDAVWEVEPFISILMQDGARAVAWPYVDTHPGMPISLAFTTPQLVADEPELVESFVAALHESMEHAQQNPDEARRIMTTYTELTAEQVEALILPSWVIEVDRDGVETLVELAVLDGLIGEAPDLEALLP